MGIHNLVKAPAVVEDDHLDRLLHLNIDPTGVDGESNFTGDAHGLFGNHREPVHNIVLC